MPTNRPPKAKPDDQSKTGANDPSQVEGEGSYTASRRHRESVEDYLQSHDVQQDAREAAPKDDKQAQEMAEAEKKGKKHARH